MRKKWDLMGSEGCICQVERRGTRTLKLGLNFSNPGGKGPAKKRGEGGQ